MNNETPDAGKLKFSPFNMIPYIQLGLEMEVGVIVKKKVRKRPVLVSDK